MRGLKVYVCGYLTLIEHMDGKWSLHSHTEILLDHESILTVLGWLSDQQLRLFNLGADTAQVAPYTQAIELLNVRVLSEV